MTARQPSRWHEAWFVRGIAAALAAAALFGLGTPFAKVLVETVDPWLLAGLLYAGSGIGLTLWRALRRAPPVRPARAEWRYLAGAIFAGGIVGPVLLMNGLVGLTASTASLLLSTEGVLTALLAWFVFRENFDRRIAAGMVAIGLGATILAWRPGADLARICPALLVLGACLAWAIDNNLTRKLSLLDATWLASIKGLVAGATNLAIAALLGSAWPAGGRIAAALTVGAFAYGASLALFVVALRYLGAARTAAYFSTAPFVGAVVALLWLAEPVTVQFALAGGLMALGVWLHLTEHHSHLHHHPALEHEHEHEHDPHHRHAHESGDPPGDRHRHRHRHEPMTHAHEHFPDAHHQHDHSKGG